MTMTLVERVELTSSQASITFSNIPQDGTDLLLLTSLRGAATSSFPELQIKFNGSSTSYSSRYLVGGGSDGFATGTGGSTSILAGVSTGSQQTANTFNNAEIYIPNYVSANNKILSSNVVAENNATFGYMHIVTGLWSNTAAISSIEISLNGISMISGSSATLYKITKGSDGTTTVA